MEGLFCFFCVEDVLLYGGRRHVGFLKVLPDDVDGEVGGVAHVAGVESVVAKLVEEYLVGGEVGGGRTAVCMVADEGVGSKEQRAFAELVLMEAVGQMADGTDGEYESALELMQAREEGLPGVDYLGYGEQLAVEEVGGQFVAVGHGASLAGAVGKTVGVGGAKGDE